MRQYFNAYLFLILHRLENAHKPSYILLRSLAGVFVRSPVCLRGLISPEPPLHARFQKSPGYADANICSPVFLRPTESNRLTMAPTSCGFLFSTFIGYETLEVTCGFQSEHGIMQNFSGNLRVSIRPPPSQNQRKVHIMKIIRHGSLGAWTRKTFEKVSFVRR